MTYKHSQLKLSDLFFIVISGDVLVLKKKKSPRFLSNMVVHQKSWVLLDGNT